MTDSLDSRARDLLARPLIALLGTVRPDGSPQVNPMWFEFDGEHILFTHTSRRGKFRNLRENPGMSVALVDPDQPYRYAEIRGRLVETRPDPEGGQFIRLRSRYGDDSTTPPPDAADRIVLVMSVDRVLGQG